MVHLIRNALRPVARRDAGAVAKELKKVYTAVDADAALDALAAFADTDLGFMWHVPLFALGTRWVGDRKVKMVIVRHSKEDLLRLKELVERGEYRPVIDRSYPLEDVVEASRYVETGQKTGNVVLIMGG